VAEFAAVGELTEFCQRRDDVVWVRRAVGVKMTPGAGAAAGVAGRSPWVPELVRTVDGDDAGPILVTAAMDGRIERREVRHRDGKRAGRDWGQGFRQGDGGRRIGLPRDCKIMVYDRGEGGENSNAWEALRHKGEDREDETPRGT